ncbi:PPK2 family polyphosphate kinase [Mariniflexile jejuense]|uniref:PPK2 family polyphosphate kinase n=1 Tax=Mariniflexile jejuense TaxID=1173582 RepID=A0ABW3JLE7_9FLAO
MEDNLIEKYKVTTSISLKNTKTKVVIKKADRKLEDLRKDLGKLQDTMYAHDKYSVLVCLQGMDTSGKDSLIREVFKEFNVRGVVVHSFKVPTELELSHDYLWRHYIALPERGKFAVFNRTHYENVLVTRVHPNYILGENIPTINSVDDINDAFWDTRFEQINNFEKHVAENGTIIFKFFLNLSKEEQKSRLLRRLEKQEKNWKFSAGDLKERKLWDNYQFCYEDAINRTSKPYAPWHIIPADDKDTARYIVAKIMYDTLSKYTDIQEPELDDAIKANIELYKKELESE